MWTVKWSQTNGLCKTCRNIILDLTRVHSSVGSCCLFPCQHWPHPRVGSAGTAKAGLGTRGDHPPESLAVQKRQKKAVMPSLAFLFVSQQALSGARRAGKGCSSPGEETEAAAGRGETISCVGGKDSSDFTGRYMWLLRRRVTLMTQVSDLCIKYSNNSANIADAISSWRIHKQLTFAAAVLLYFKSLTLQRERPGFSFKSPQKK